MKNHRIVVVTPAGRKRYMEIALPYILRERGFIDEYRIWINTLVQEDLDYFTELQASYPDFITLEHCYEHLDLVHKNERIHNFFRNTIDPETVYIRVDDDVIWFEKDYFKSLYKFRVENPEYFFISGNIVNNAICDYIHQFKKKIYPREQFKFGYECTDTIGWNSPLAAEYKHSEFLKDVNPLKYKFSYWDLRYYERISINSICWFGETFKEFGGRVAMDEEPWLTHTKPKQIEIPGCIDGSSVCVHFAFFPQREHLEKNTSLLSKYKELSLYV